MPRPEGIVTFLFTDIEGSTRRWEADASAMRAELVSHDKVLSNAIDSAGGWLFKHTGDGVCAAFVSPRAAVEAAIESQKLLELPVRMGIATGEAVARGDDYFGPTLNLTGRVMAAGHGGQIVVSESTAALLTEFELLDLGVFRLRDLAGPQRLFQLMAPELPSEFPPLVTASVVPGHLPVAATTLVGRSHEITEVAAVLRAHRLVTLTGVGGVGKTRLALQVAAELADEFSDGVWLVELAEVGDPEEVPAAVVAALRLTPQAGRSLPQTISEAMAPRKALVVLDNCEHVIDASAEMAHCFVAPGGVVKVLATSREGLRAEGEYLWAVPSLDVSQGLESVAVELFVERARSVNKDFSISTADDAAAVTEICERLDGIPLAIELAAARMVSMGPADVRDRLHDRFRLLAGGRRGLERHQTLRHAVQWSYELLDADERELLKACSVFAGDFDLVSAMAVWGESDEYRVIDVMDSLVRRSLLNAERSGGHARHRMLETIRQFAEDQLSSSDEVVATRDRHCRLFASAAERNWDVWTTTRQVDAYRWYHRELPDLRAAFRWAVERGDIDAATAIAARTVFLAVYSQSFEPIGWCESLLENPATAEHPLRKWLHMGASLCAYEGRYDEAVDYGEAGLALDAVDGYEPVFSNLDRSGVAVAHLFSGRPERFMALGSEGRETDVLEMGSIGAVWIKATMGDTVEAMHLADEMLEAAERTGIPWSISYAHAAYGRAFSQSDPDRALEAFRRAVQVARESDNRMWEVVMGRDLIGLEATRGDPGSALGSFSRIIDGFYQTGDVGNLAPTLGYLVVLLSRIGRSASATTVLGATQRYASAETMVVGLAETGEHLRSLLGETGYERNFRTGAAMDTTTAVSYAHEQIRLALDT